MDRVKSWEAAQLGGGMVKFLTTHLSWAAQVVLAGARTIVLKVCVLQLL